jgi:hypothetical protein
MPDLFNVNFKAVWTIPLRAEAEPLTTANAVVTYIFSFPFLVTELTLSLLAARSTGLILGDVILNQVMSLPICILKGTHNFLPSLIVRQVHAMTDQKQRFSKGGYHAYNWDIIFW